MSSDCRRSNVLISSAGRRAALVRSFQQELRVGCAGARVFATDMNPAMSSACHIAEAAFAVPPASDPEFVMRLHDIGCKEGVGLIIPTIDTELQVLADNRDLFDEAGIHVAVSSPSLVRQCRDKRKTGELFAEIGIAVPKAIDPTGDTAYPIFARPYNGSCSKNVQVIHSPDDRHVAVDRDPSLIFSEYIDPQVYDEYTIDAYYDRRGQLRCLVPRKRIETRAGEVSKGRTTQLPNMDALWESFSKLTGARGCLTIQVFVHKESYKFLGIEINPRFGGGYPLSYEAGANYPGWLIAEYLLEGELPAECDWEDGLTMLRYDEHVLVRNHDS